MSKTIEKGLQLLDLFTEDKPSWRLEEISTEKKIPKATALRILRSFVEYGYLQRIPVERNGVLIDGDSYSLGLKLLQLGELVASGLEIRQIALPYMRLLQCNFNEAVQLVTREKLEGVYIEKVESTRPVRLYTRVGRLAPLYAGACTRTLLSFLSDEEINEILHQTMNVYASNTPKTSEEVWQRIEETRKSGFAYSNSELEEGTVSIAVPIFNRKGIVEFSISIAGFATSLPEENIDKYIEPLWEVAAHISNKIGFSRPYPYGPHMIKINNKGMEI
ncbi:IclR family transcriptional regulator [Paenisporosarcina sp. OV554]|uniref:IclR family transcriptional regulator n=1 Tax=Paenisporosarcina sp. OV554 TaxID=2135694 RepID=UPI000D39FC85|nr:IclR family transcriptional regulator [Paenisporosarcina sp. OV554]PUB10788.1 IclR family transcriptional regulator [Paenisporosarcina sp. OV554]